MSYPILFLTIIVLVGAIFRGVFAFIGVLNGYDEWKVTCPPWASVLHNLSIVLIILSYYRSL